MPLARLALLLPLLAALLAAGATPAHARPVTLGIGEQQPGMFSDPYWAQLGIPHARFLTQWDALRHKRERGLLDAWVEAARAAGAQMTIAFTHSHRARRDPREFPTRAQFRAAFAAFRARYPDVRDWIVWNEANHPSSLSAHRPRKVAMLFDVASHACQGCRIVGADVLDISGMEAWIRRFTLAARTRPRYWGLHNYVDAQHGGSAGTRRFLAVTRGKVWFTETGGWILRRKYQRGRLLSELRSSPRHQAQATRHALGLACMSRRVQRVYIYNWQAPQFPTTWDSGLIGPRGTPRPAYDLLLRKVRNAGAPVARCRRGRLLP
jgi:hypothetical protein